MLVGGGERSRPATVRPTGWGGMQHLSYFLCCHFHILVFGGCADEGSQPVSILWGPWLEKGGGLDVIRRLCQRRRLFSQHFPGTRRMHIVYRIPSASCPPDRSKAIGMTPSFLPESQPATSGKHLLCERHRGFPLLHAHGTAERSASRFLISTWIVAPRSPQ